MSLINTCNLLLTNLHRCLDEAVKAVYGFAPLPVAGSLVDRAASLKATFDENPSAFVATPTHLAALNSLLAEYRQQAFLANTTTITVEATRLIAWNDVINKPVKFPPKAHTTAWADITDAPATYPPADHAHDLLQIGGLLLRYNSTEGYLEQSTNAGATWTPLVSNSAPPSATAYALSWAGITDASIKSSRALPGAWVNGNLQIWMRLSIDAATYGSYLLNALSFTVLCDYDGAIGVSYYNSNGDEQTLADSRTGLSGWHDIGLQWTQANNSCIIYLDGVGGTPFSASKNDVDTGGAYTLEIGAPSIKLAALVWGNALTWSAATAAKDTITPITMNLPLTEGSGATTTDSTGTAWTIPAGVTWEVL